MDSQSIGSLVYLVLLGCVVGSYFLISHRRNIGQMARHALLWGLIFLGVIAGVGLWSDIRRDIAPQQSVFAEEGRIEVPQAHDGHFYMTAQVNGKPVMFVVDTGATDIVLTRQDARMVGIDPERLVYSGRAGTANGVVDTARTTVDEFAVGPLVDRDVAVWVNRGEMNTSLLGMAYLRRFERIEISDGTLVLER
ncbi:TIGR02281 family clan AA aspartic protease [Psychromarinibacter sp. C21-152]|uniref:TIGR02281 family clan AA aspartic protease n=1 Tax=Psychromarinibacter sediminicola TaxID=3033385 RepID=A0AAE3NLC8_9RHOB|nr:TIGR02281 family clan AA aspartic protease [Psychromarinibacter sediminicola]MDF0600048.1 TIGR02281 family clan AA aspartic protease [Psychromarinibacter sediminicola]